MWTISRKLVQSYNSYSLFTPTLLIKSRIFKLSLRVIPLFKSVKNKKSIEEIIGQQIAGFFLNKIAFGHIRNLFIYSNNLVKVKHNNWKLWGLSATRRSWIYEEERNFIDNRIVKNLTIVYHEGNRVGAHLDIHIGHLSLVYRLSGKNFGQIKFNSEGQLTAASKELLLNHLRSELSNHSRVPQNHCHTLSNARMNWNYNPELSKEYGYGVGPVRTIVAQSKCEIYHTAISNSLHVYAPIIDSNNGLYIYKIYPKANILIAGILKSRASNFDDRLHLKMEDDLNSFYSKVDPKTITTKYDGSSMNFSTSGEVENNHSIKIYSTRKSKETNNFIEHTYKFVEFANYITAIKCIGIGEGLFYKLTPIGWITKYFGYRGIEGVCWRYLDCASIGGVLNANSVRSRTIFPELRIYRINNFEGKNVINLPFFENRKLQILASKQMHPDIKVVQLVSKNNPKKEGLVGVQEGLSINEGIKFKNKADEIDMIIKSIDFYFTEKDRIAGTIKCEFNNKIYEFGSGQFGNFDKCRELISNKQNYIERYVKTQGFNGGIARASKITSIQIHEDK